MLKLLRKLLHRENEMPASLPSMVKKKNDPPSAEPASTALRKEGAEQDTHYMPNSLHDLYGCVTYKTETFLGRGSFGYCYKISNALTKHIYASKVIPKQSNLKTMQKLKRQAVLEASVQRSLNHPHIVKFFSCFEDKLNIYLVMEFCEQGCLLELVESRQQLTELECRYFMLQLMEGVNYLHERLIVHRDLKLENLLLTKQLRLKIADFGLAMRMEYEEELLVGLCGTPDYMAPEMLSNTGYGMEVDIWAMGCIMFALLTGETPFEESSLREMCIRVCKCSYRMPSHVSSAATAAIKGMLTPQPQRRTTLKKLYHMEYFTKVAVPKSLPVSCMEKPPELKLLEYTGVVNLLHIESYTQFMECELTSIGATASFSDEDD